MVTNMRIGLDVGSTTLKCVVLDDENNIIYKSYKRHFAQITESTLALLKEIEKGHTGRGRRGPVRVRVRRNGNG